MNYCHDGRVSVELPLKFPNGTTPVTCHISAYDSSLDIKASMESLMGKALAPILPAGCLYMEEVHVEGLASKVHL